jgi:zinc protease
MGYQLQPEKDYEEILPGIDLPKMVHMIHRKMKLNYYLLSMLVAMMILIVCCDAYAMTSDTIANPVPEGELIPVDTAILMGEFSNGLTYYILENRKPENRAQLWLVVNAGSVLEDEDQLGLAHFTEHMAFNGTKNFAKQEIINYLESIGMKFGPEINAYTGFDETVYMLQLPTDSAELIEKGFQILADWAQHVSFEPEEVDKERGVVIEEWRLGRGANMRLLDKQLPGILKDSRYANRLPIGKVEVIENFDHQSLKRFYTDWYRPDLMAVIAVGDFDAVDIQDYLGEYFEKIPAVAEPREREVFTVPDHEETVFAIATDPEATNSSLAVYYKMEAQPEKTIGDYRRMLMEQIFSRMLNVRLYELVNQSDPPFLFGYVSSSNLVRTLNINSLNVGVKEDGMIRGLESIITEASRVQKHGFTQTELDRTKIWLKRRMEKTYSERDKTESARFAAEYMRNFLEEEPIPGIVYEYQAVNQLLPGIALEEINEMVGKWLGESNRVVLLSAPEKEDVEIPSEEALLSVFASVGQKDILPYDDAVSDLPLMEDLPKMGKVVREDALEKLGISSWKLSNGIRIILKPTDFKNDEVLFQGFSPGGHSLAATEDYRSVRASTEIIKLSGVGEFDLNALNKKLTGKVVSIFPYINELNEGITGSASPDDLETMFQLIYLYLTRPRKDTEAYLSYKARMEGFIQNRHGSPEAAFYDTIMVTIAQYHMRSRPWSLELLDEIDPEVSWSFYNDRFEDTDDFTFVFVGKFHPDSLRPLVLQYLGNLPGTDREETWRDTGIIPPAGVIKKTIYRGQEEKSQVSLIFTGEHPWSRKDHYAISSMASVMRIKLRETLREDLSGTYGTSIGTSLSLYPREEYRITISFGCEPDRVDELIGAVFQVIDSVQLYGPEISYVDKVKETQRRSFETSLEQNRFWLSNLVTYAMREQDPAMILDYPAFIEALNPMMVKDAAMTFFNKENYVQVVLRPEHEKQ